MALLAALVEAVEHAQEKRETTAGPELGVARVARRRKGETMKNGLVCGILAALALAATAVPAQIQPAPYVTIHYDRIDPAKMREFEANSRQWVAVFGGAQAGPEFTWRAYQSGYSYAWVSDMPNYAFLDGNEERQKKADEMLGEGKLEELNAGGAVAVAEHHNEIWKHEPELTYQPAGFSPVGMGAINVAVVDVRPAMGKQYRELVKEAIAALKTIAAPVNFIGYSIPFGDGSYSYVSWAKDRAALHSGPEMAPLLTQAVGAEKAAEMYQRYRDCVADGEERDWLVRADLSYLQPAERVATEAAAAETQ